MVGHYNYSYCICYHTFLCYVTTAPRIIMASTPTLEEITKRLNLRESQLALEVTDTHITTIAGSLDNWLKYAEALHLKSYQIQDIHTNKELDYLMKIQRVSVRDNENLKGLSTVEPPSKGHFGTNTNSGHLSSIEGLSLFGGSIHYTSHR